MAPYCPDTGYEITFHFRLVRADQGSMLHEFAIMVLSRRADTEAQWVEVEKFDSSHGYVHRHRFRGAEYVIEEEFVPIELREDLDEALKWAREYLWDKSEEGWEEWLSPLKNEA